MPPKRRAESQGKAKAKAKASGAPAAGKAKPGGPKAKAKSANAKAAASAADQLEADVPAPAEAALEAPTEELNKEPAEELPVPAAPLEEAAPFASSEQEAAEAEPEAARREPVEVRAKQLELVPDPWEELDDEAALEKVKDESWDVSDINDLDEAVATSAACHVLAKDSGRRELADNASLQHVAVSLDLSECQLARVDALPALWLRQLLLGANPVESLDGIDVLFPKLMCIDLSFVDLSSVEGVWEALAACPHLRSLVAESAGVSSFEDLVLIPPLQSLELLENDVEELEELQTLATRCPSLRRLDLRENAVASEPGYAKAVKKHFPKLTWHDNQSLKKYVAEGRDKIGYCNLNAEINAVDGLYKNESCSCLEGNPCLDPATCIDWEHREGIAAEARKRKGLRDDSGKQL